MKAIQLNLLTLFMIFWIFAVLILCLISNKIYIKFWRYLFNFINKECFAIIRKDKTDNAIHHFYGIFQKQINMDISNIKHQTNKKKKTNQN